jgi:hypothetical protein
MDPQNAQSDTTTARSFLPFMTLDKTIYQWSSRI